MEKYFKSFIIFFLPFLVYSQETISGKVLFKSDNLDYPIEGANIYWLNSSQGTVTNQEGGFSIVTYTGTGSAGTVAHGLGKTPTFWLMKSMC